MAENINGIEPTETEKKKNEIINIDFKKFTANDAHALTNLVKPYEDKTSYVESDYKEIIQKIKTASQIGKTSIKLEPNSALEKRITSGTIDMLISKGFTVERNSKQDMYESQYFGITISW